MLYIVFSYILRTLIEAYFVVVIVIIYVLVLLVLVLAIVAFDLCLVRAMNIPLGTSAY